MLSLIHVKVAYKISKLNYHTKGNSNKHALNYLTYQIVYNGNLLWPSGKLSNMLRGLFNV